MATIFTRIIEGKLPARFVWKDDRCVVFLSNRPLRPGHALVVPLQEIYERWISKFERPRLKALHNLKRRLEGEN